MAATPLLSETLATGSLSSGEAPSMEGEREIGKRERKQGI